MKRTVILGITGGIASYKACEIVSRLKKLNYKVRVIMTQNATEFITPLTLETLSEHRVVTDMFDKERSYEVEHISYAKLADAFVIAPATANVIAKIAEGIADDMLTTTIMATKAPIIIAPAMNTNMFNSEACQKNMAILKERGCIFIEPIEGLLACGDVGKGKMAEPENIVQCIDNMLTPCPDFRGKRVLITAGATKEPIDGVRYITNHSSGKMGVALAECALNRGAEVTMVVGSVSVPLPEGANIVKISTTQDMFQAVMDNLGDSEVIIKAAAPADYKVKNYSPLKIKSENLTLELVKNPDIARAVGAKKGDKKLVVFAAETHELMENAHRKLQSKNADLIVANDVTQEGAGFNVDTNIATLITSDGRITALEKMSKVELADIILDTIAEL
ncbi:MAG: bifunctional phosphopantothenoylcysteine decarboxylase/phosphopantothenate--cysteine ligase CoaBC [Bacillota bacterium]